MRGRGHDDDISQRQSAVFTSSLMITASSWVTGPLCAADSCCGSVTQTYSGPALLQPEPPSDNTAHHRASHRGGVVVLSRGGGKYAATLYRQYFIDIYQTPSDDILSHKVFGTFQVQTQFLVHKSKGLSRLFRPLDGAKCSL